MEVDEFIGSYWLHCFKQNEIYRKYCEAKSLNDVAICQELEAVHERLAQLYHDWGDIREVSSDETSNSYLQWAKRKQGLVSTTQIYWYVDDEILKSHYRFKPGNLLMNIPLQDSKTATLEKVKEVLDLLYRFRERAKTDDLGMSETAKLMFLPLERPKYELHGDLNSTSIGKLKKAIYIGKMDKTISLVETIKLIKEDDKNPFNWHMSSSDRIALSDGTFDSSYSAGSEVTMVSQFRAHFAALVSNTIYGRFPDYA